MTQEESCLARNSEVIDFMEKNHRNLSRHRLEEHLKHNRKLMNKGKMKDESGDV